MLLCATISRAEENKQIHLEDIEHDTLIRERETERDEDDHSQKELAPQPTQHIQLSYSNTPQDVFVTPTPSGRTHYTVNGNWQKINQSILKITPINHSSRFTSWVKAAGLSSSKSSWGRRAVIHCSSKTNAHSTDYWRWPANSNDNDSTTSIHLPSIDITSTPSICFAGTVSSASKLDNFRLDRGKKSWKWKEICAWMINRQQQPFHQCKIIKLLMSALEYQVVEFFYNNFKFKKKIWLEKILNFVIRHHLATMT